MREDETADWLSCPASSPPRATQKRLSLIWNRGRPSPPPEVVPSTSGVGPGLTGSCTSAMETILHRLHAAQATNAFFNRWMGAEQVDQGTPGQRIDDE